VTDAPRVIVRGVRKAEGLAPRQPLPRAARQHVGPRPGEAYWQERGWRQRGTGPFTGSYRAGRECFEGRINAKDRLFLIRRPPEALRAHRHWICFRYREDGWYAVHFATLPRDMSSGIMEIERILCEALGTTVPTTAQRTIAQAVQAVVNQSRTRTEPHDDDTRKSEHRTSDTNFPETVQQLVAQAAEGVINRSRTRQEVQDDIRAAGHLPWWWIIIFVAILFWLMWLVG
jgi:hypothetical protein